MTKTCSQSINHPAARTVRLLAWVALLPLLAACAALPSSASSADSTARPRVLAGTPAATSLVAPATVESGTPTAGVVIVPALPSSTAEPSFLPTAGLRVFGGNEGTHGLPATDGTTVVWGDASDRIRSANLSSGQEYAPVAMPGSEMLFSVSGQMAAWRVADPGAACPPDCPGHIVVENLATHSTIGSGQAHANEMWPEVAGDWLVWVTLDPLPGPPQTRPVPGPNGNRVMTETLLARNLRTMAPPVVLRQTTDALSRPVLNGERVVWGEQEARPDGQVWARVLMEPVTGGQPQVLAEGLNVSPYGYDFQGDLLVYSAASQQSFGAVNLRTGWREIFPNAVSPTTDGRYIFWIDFNTIATSRKVRQDIWGYDAEAGRAFPLAANAGVNDFPMARNGWVVWLHHPGTLSSVTQVYAADVAQALAGSR